MVAFINDVCDLCKLLSLHRHINNKQIEQAQENRILTKLLFTHEQEKTMSTSILQALSAIVGQDNILTKNTNTYMQGFRYGGGEALAVIKPATLLELWQVAKACVEQDVIIITQAANTGLTGGSTPFGDYDRDAVIVNTMRIKGIRLIKDATQIIALPGSTLFELEDLLKPHAREPHSVIGSSSIGATIVGGVCNNSGGALINRGPAYTEMALYGQINADGELVLVNHLGIELGENPEEILARLDNNDYRDSDIASPADKVCSDQTYSERLRQLDIDKAARYNNDPDRLYEVSGSAGKLLVFAVRLDTYEKAEREQVFYIGSNSTQVLAELRQHILTTFEHLPVMGEYLHRSYFDIGERYGRDTFLVIDKLGTKHIPAFFAFKNKADRLFAKIPFMPSHLSDHVLQFVTNLLPSHLPKIMCTFRDQYEHHVILKVTDDSIEETHAFLQTFFQENAGSYHVCNAKEGKAALLHRFAAAGAAKRFHIVKKKTFGNVLALDIALKRNEKDWFESLPAEINEQLVDKLYCGHFFCNVMHHDYLLKRGVDAMALKDSLLTFLDAKGAEYPAEHNVGHLYQAKPDLAAFYQSLDPTNSLNPGIGKTPKYKYWHEAPSETE